MVPKAKLHYSQGSVQGMRLMTIPGHPYFDSTHICALNRDHLRHTKARLGSYNSSIVLLSFQGEEPADMGESDIDETEFIPTPYGTPFGTPVKTEDIPKTSHSPINEDIIKKLRFSLQ